MEVLMQDFSMYNPDGSPLRKAQLRMLEMLTFIDSVCQKHKINYWLGAGTLLGAVRHQGFIPWDDDVDIEMTKPDYLRLIECLKLEMSPGYVLQTHDTDRNYVFPVAKLRDKNSKVNEMRNANVNYKFRGVFVDIFFIERGGWFLARLSNILYKPLYALSWLKNDRFGLLIVAKIALAAFLERLVLPFFRLFASVLRLKSYVLPFGTGFHKNIDLKDVFPLQRIQFEGRLFNAPGRPDSYLTAMYGDYMRLPEPSQRRTHTVSIEVF